MVLGYIPLIDIRGYMAALQPLYRQSEHKFGHTYSMLHIQSRKYELPIDGHWLNYLK